MRRFSVASEIPVVCIFRFDSSLTFANRDYVENQLTALGRT